MSILLFRQVGQFTVTIIDSRKSLGRKRLFVSEFAQILYAVCSATCNGGRGSYVCASPLVDTGQFHPKEFSFPRGRKEKLFCVSVLPFLKKTGEREMANYASLSHCPSKSPAAQGEKEFAPPAYSRRREKDIFRTQQNGSRAYTFNVSLGLTPPPPPFSSFRRRLRQNAATFTFVLPFPLYARRAKRGRGEKRGGTTRQKSEAR